MVRLGWVNATIVASMLAALIALGGCGQFTPKYMKPLSAHTRALLAEKGMTEDSPILIRIFKAESELEVWKAKDDGRFYHFKTYPVCSYSGGLGPKLRQGDRQAPEGFYYVNRDQMNPRSKYHLAFNMGFPNSYDRANGRTGANLMVHGDCSSSGCYAMTDAVMEEIYILAREALSGDQEAFQVQAYPFRMTAANLAAQKGHKWHGFWRQLKEGHDYFQITRLPPRVEVCSKTYLINASFDGGRRPDPAGPCPAYRKLPVQAAPKVPKFQQASAKSGSRSAQSSIGKPLGSALGLSFGPLSRTYRAFTIGPAAADASK